jgi:hypothetical protein
MSSTIKMPKQLLAQWLFTILFVSVVLIANAQKPSSTQKISIRVPSTTKVDGKAAEWDNKFQAYSSHTNLYYTMANDDNKLYLIIRAITPDIVKRAVNGSITLTINTAGQKSNQDAFAITFPIFEKNNRFTPPFIRQGKFDAYKPQSWSDSMVTVANKRFNDRAKLIQVIGIKGIDTLISVYNTDGIKAVALFDNNAAYTYELAVPLKSLGLSIAQASKFTYQVRINDVETHGIKIATNDGSSADISSVDMSNLKSISVSSGAQIGQAATDFWGEYTLAK